jgi:hypothetical protein
MSGWRSDLGLRSHIKYTPGKQYSQGEAEYVWLLFSRNQPERGLNIHTRSVPGFFPHPIIRPRHIYVPRDYLVSSHILNLPLSHFHTWSLSGVSPDSPTVLSGMRDAGPPSAEARSLVPAMRRHTCTNNMDCTGTHADTGENDREKRCFKKNASSHNT